MISSLYAAQYAWVDSVTAAFQGSFNRIFCLLVTELRVDSVIRGSSVVWQSSVQGRIGCA